MDKLQRELLEAFDKMLKPQVEDWDSDDKPDTESLFQSHYSEIRSSARRMGIDLDTARTINSWRRKISPTDLLDASQGKRQWYGIGTAWLDWVSTNMPDWFAPCTYVLEFNDNPVVVDSPETIKQFSSKYVLNPEAPKDLAINWSKLYKDGIKAVEFSNYNRGNARMGGADWYRSVDMNSGAVVNKSIVKRVTLLYDGTEEFKDAGIKKQ